MKARKYSYLIVLQGNYGCGWEDLSAEDLHSGANQYGTPRQRIKADLRAYRENEGGSYRVIRRRELIKGVQP